MTGFFPRSRGVGDGIPCLRVKPWKSLEVSPTSADPAVIGVVVVESSWYLVTYLARYIHSIVLLPMGWKHFRLFLVCWNRGFYVACCGQKEEGKKNPA